MMKTNKMYLPAFQTTAALKQRCSREKKQSLIHTIYACIKKCNQMDFDRLNWKIQGVIQEKG